MSDSLAVTQKMRPPRTISSAEIKQELRAWASASILSVTWKMILLAVLFGFICSAVLLWKSATTEMLARIQTFNGALTIPVGALTWAFAFTFVFLVPMKAMQILMAKSMLYSIEAQEELVDEIKRDLVEPLKDGRNPVADRLETALNNGIDRICQAIREQGANVNRELDEALAEGELKARKVAESTPPE